MYTIGQVLYVILSKKNQVYPMQVIEVITKKTLTGEQVSYLLQAGPNVSSTVMLDKVDGEVFETAEKARSILTKRATSQIDKLVSAAVKKSSEWYSKSIEQQTPQTIDDLPEFGDQIDIDTPPADATVTLPDGTVAKIKLPSNI